MHLVFIYILFNVYLYLKSLFLVIKMEYQSNMKYMTKKALCKKWMLSLFLTAAVSNVYANPVNVHTASVEELAAALNGIGMKKAQSILDYCVTNACQNADDLLNVKGIGEKTLEGIRMNLVFDEQIPSKP